MEVVCNSCGCQHVSNSKKFKERYKDVEYDNECIFCESELKQVQKQGNE